MWLDCSTQKNKSAKRDCFRNKVEALTQEANERSTNMISDSWSPPPPQDVENFLWISSLERFSTTNKT